MLHWLTIILGTFSIAMSISNPFYNLIIKKYINVNLLVVTIIRVSLFTMGIFLVFLGLYFESNF